jgi:glycosyltransferase involved in cell wall biosynthesis
MRIALMMHELLVEGGGERQCVCLAQALVRRGHEVVIYTSDYDGANCFPEICSGLKIRNVGRGAWPSMRKLPFIRAYLDMSWLARAVDENHEIWNPHHWPAQWGALWLRSKLGGRVVWMANDVPDFALKAFHPSSLRDMLLAPLRWLYFLYDRRQNRKVDSTVVLSNYAEKQYHSHYSGVTTIVQSGMDPERFAPGGDRIKIRNRFAFADDEFVLLWLGIFMPHRRLQDAVEAINCLASRGAKVKLLLAGSDRSFPEYVRSLKGLARRLGVQDRVVFAAKVDEAEIRDFYSAADAFLFPNENQTWGLAVLEAMSCGSLALVSRGAAVHEAFTDMKDAVLFASRNPQGLADKVELLLQQPELRRHIAARGMAMVRQKFSWDRYAENVERACHEVLRRNRPTGIAPFAAASPAEDRIRIP